MSAPKYSRHGCRWRRNRYCLQMAARIAELEARIAKGGSLRFKVSEKGAVSVYGLGRFPVTLYLEQWENLLSHTDELRQFIEANRAHLKIQGQALPLLPPQPQPQAHPASPPRVRRRSSSREQGASLELRFLFQPKDSAI